MQTAASLGVRIELVGSESLCLSSDVSDSDAKEQGFGLSVQPCDGENATRWYVREHEAPVDSEGSLLVNGADSCLEFSGRDEVITTDNCVLSESDPSTAFVFFGQTIQSAKSSCLRGLPQHSCATGK